MGIRSAYFFYFVIDFLRFKSHEFASFSHNEVLSSLALRNISLLLLATP